MKIFGTKGILEKPINFGNLDMIGHMKPIYITMCYENERIHGFFDILRLTNGDNVSAIKKRLIADMNVNGRNKTKLFNDEIIRNLTPSEYMGISALFKKLNITCNKKTNELIKKI